MRYREQRTNICRNNYLDKPQILDEYMLLEIDSQNAASHRELQAKGLRRHYASVPAYRLQGPLLVINYVAKPSKHHPLGNGQNYYN